MYSNESIRELIACVEHMSTEEIRALVSISDVEFKGDPTDPSRELMIWLSEVIGRLMSIRNTTKMAYCEKVRKDIELCLVNILDKDVPKAFDPEQYDEVMQLRDAVKDLLDTHFQETFTGSKPYVPLAELPVINWIFQAGSLQNKLNTIANLFLIQDKAVH